MQAVDLLNENPNPTEEEIRVGLEGNLCRCTGYHNIVKAVAAAAGSSRARGPTPDDRHRRPSEHRDRVRDRRRKEDQRLITGRTRWTDNIRCPGMLHLAMVRSPFAHATIDRHRHQPRPRRAADVVAVFTGKDIADDPGRQHHRLADHPRPEVRPTTCRCRSTGSRFAGEIVAVVVARTAAAGPRRRRARRRRLRRAARPCSTSRRRPTDAVLAHPDLGTNKSAFWQLDSAAQGSGGDVEEAIAKAREDGIVIEREYRQQRLIPAFMEPRSIVVDPTGEQVTMWSATQVAAHPALLHRRDDRPARVQDPRHRPRRRRRLRRQAPVDARGVRRRSPWPARLGKPCKYTETRSES